MQNIEHHWSPNVTATFIVILSIASHILDRFSYREIGSPITDILSLLSLPMILFFLLQAQTAINLSLGDPEGEANSRFTIPNYLWMLLGSSFWLLIIVVLLEYAGVVLIPDA